jgi:starvation-inducible DNA-binding protein
MLKIMPGAEATSLEPWARRGESSGADEIQPFGAIARMPIGLERQQCAESVSALNQVLADTMILRDLYKKHHWQVTGEHFYPLHLLFDKHHGEQVELIDELAERVQMLGGISVAMGADAAELTRVPRPPHGRESPAVQVGRLIEAHSLVIGEVRDMLRELAPRGDEGTVDLLVSRVLRLNEKQAWFLSEILARPVGLSDRSNR